MSSTDDPYRRLLEACVASWAGNFAAEGGIESTTASVFLASPHAVTPVHVDRHHNLLLQIEGTKEVVVGAFDNPDDEAVEVNAHFDRDRSNFSTLPPHSTSWVIGPGEGLYLPPYTPHWVLTENEVTLSLSCVVRTPASNRMELAHICNARLRRMGLHPAPAGRSHRVDGVKAAVVLAGRRARESEATGAARRGMAVLARSWRTGSPGDGGGASGGVRRSSAPGKEMTTTGGLVEIDDELLAMSMWNAPFRLRHNLAGHPLVSRDALVRLAGERPAFSVEIGRSDLPVVYEGPGMARELTAAAAAADIENSKSWIVLSFVDNAPGYGELLDAVSLEFRGALAAHDGSVRARTGTIFMTSPHGVVAAHMDRHHNVLLQIEGTKELSVGEFDDEPARELEIQRHFQDDYLLRLPTRYQTFTLGPGEGVYIPPYRPHWVVGREDVSVGLSCSVRTDTSHRVEMAHAFNSKLRRLGLRPRMPGTRRGVDSAKALVVTTRREVQHIGEAVARQLRKDHPPSSTGMPPGDSRG